MCIPPKIFHPVDERQLLSPENRSVHKYDTATITDANALLAATTFIRNDFDQLCQFAPEQTTAVCYVLLFGFLRAPETNLGKLRKFPLEILHHIIRHLPIQTLLHLRHVNLRFRDVVTSLPLYKWMATHAGTALLAVTRFQIAEKVSLPALHKVSTSDKCSVCGEFARYIFMPTLQRSCRSCIFNPFSDNPFQVERITTAQRKTLTRYENDTFRIIRSVPSAFDVEKYMAWDKRPLDRDLTTQKQWLVATKQFPEGTGVDITRKKSDGHDYIASDFKRFASVDVPPLEVLDGLKVTEQRGFGCNGCKEAWSEDVRQAVASGFMPHCGSPVKGMSTREYSRRGFLEHFVWCKRAQRMWEATSAQGESVAMIKNMKGDGLGVATLLQEFGAVVAGV